MSPGSGRNGSALPGWPVQRVFAPLLGSTAPVVRETWLTTLPLRSGRDEEIAWRRGYIDDGAFEKLIQPIRESEYGKYLQRLLARG